MRRLSNNPYFLIFLAALFVLVPVAPGAMQRSFAEDPPGKTGKHTPEEARAAIEGLAGLRKALAALQTRLAQRSFAPAELARSLGADPAASFAYVRDHVRF